MSKVVINIDTKTMQMSASIDGENIENIREAHISKYGDEKHPYMDINIYVESEQMGDLTKRTTLTAYANNNDKTSPTNISILPITEDMDKLAASKMVDKIIKENCKTRRYW